MTNAKEGVYEASRRLEAALAAGDAAAWAAEYTSDARLMPPETPAITDPEAIQGYWQAVIDMGIKSIVLRTLDLQDMGDTAIDVGEGDLVLENDDGRVEFGGKFIVIWKRQADGTWKMQQDCFNFDAPMG